MDHFEVITDANTGEQTIRPFTPEEIAALGPTADDIRAQRNAMLSACDWTQVADAPVDQAAWAVYRQELRDIPDQPGFPANVVWPVAPS
jgi:hypothetical protein